jgi:2-oxoglutarate/2-oxoacid ferredoxin oxidoreductase subunit alpha
MVEDVRLAVGCDQKVEHYGRVGGMIHSPDQVLEAMEKQIIGG